MKTTTTTDEVRAAVRDLIHLQGRSQSDVAKAAGVTQAQLSDWLVGRKVPNVASLLAILNELNACVADLGDVIQFRRRSGKRLSLRLRSGAVLSEG